MFLLYAFFVGFCIKSYFNCYKSISTSTYMMSSFPQNAPKHMMSMIEFSDDDFPVLEDEPIENHIQNDSFPPIPKISLLEFSGMDERFIRSESNEEYEIFVLVNYIKKKNLLDYLQNPKISTLEKIQKLPSVPQPPFLTIHLHAAGLMNDWL